MIQSIRGTKDLLPDEIKSWQYLENVCKTVSELFGYEEIRTPIFEKTEVFSRGIGEDTDVVNKEMYTFEDRSGDSMTLRPENTAAIVRALIQHKLLNVSPVVRLWYFGPFFRYERPQKGRQRQFHQYGAECIGTSSPESDAEMIQLAQHLIDHLGIKDFKILLNTLGDSESRTNYRNALVEYFSDHSKDISEDSKKRLLTNPLRILDSKDRNDIEISKNAPKILDHLNDLSRDHFEKVKEYLDATKVKYEINPNLVRGLDYYSHTVFEFQSSVLGAQDSFGGGGRYDGLFEQLGGKPAPAIGFAMGVERLLLILEQQQLLDLAPKTPDAYIVTANNELIGTSLTIASELRKNEMIVLMDVLQRSMKAQFRDANKSNSETVIIVGDEELKRGNVTLKTMETGEQSEVPLSDITKHLS
jgi:histidyl-tRNA synthetase